MTDFVKAALGVLAEYRLADLQLIIEPGRALVGPHGVLIARVICEKPTRGRRWLFIDAGMNDLMRPALYGARHRIEPLERLPSGPVWHVAGPVCESADDFGEHELGTPAPEFVVIRDAAAYGFSMANEYNGRALPSEVFIRAGSVFKVSASPGTETWVSRRLDA
jgi:diaminopimelate decarboxylase